MVSGYRFRMTSFESSAASTKGSVENIGIAPIYYDAHVAVDGIRSATSLKGLLPVFLFPLLALKELSILWLPLSVTVWFLVSLLDRRKPRPVGGGKNSFA